MSLFSGRRQRRRHVKRQVTELDRSSLEDRDDVLLQLLLAVYASKQAQNN